MTRDDVLAPALEPGWRRQGYAAAGLWLVTAGVAARDALLSAWSLVLLDGGTGPMSARAIDDEQFWWFLAEMLLVGAGMVWGYSWLATGHGSNRVSPPLRRHRPRHYALMLLPGPILTWPARLVIDLRRCGRGRGVGGDAWLAGLWWGSVLLWCGLRVALCAAIGRQADAGPARLADATASYEWIRLVDTATLTLASGLGAVIVLTTTRLLARDRVEPEATSLLG